MKRNLWQFKGTTSGHDSITAFNGDYAAPVQVRNGASAIRRLLTSTPSWSIVPSRFGRRPLLDFLQACPNTEIRHSDFEKGGHLFQRLTTTDVVPLIESPKRVHHTVRPIAVCCLDCGVAALWTCRWCGESTDPRRVRPPGYAASVDALLVPQRVPESVQCRAFLTSIAFGKL